MATVAANLFVDNEGNTLLYNQYGGTPAIPAMVAGDTLALSVYYLDRGSGSSPYRGHRYESADTTVRLRAWGNNHVYATGDDSAEIAPATGAVVTTLANGGGSSIGRKHVEFGSEPFTGYFTLTFTAPTTCRGNDPANQGMRTVHGTTGPIHILATAAEIAAAINALSWQKYDEHGDKVGGLFSPLDFAEAAFVITNLDSTGFDIEYGTSLYSGNGGTMCNPQCYQLVPPGVALPVVNMGNVEFKFGWTVNVPLTDGDFTNLFLEANEPAYLEVLLTPSGEGQVYAAQYQIESSGGGGGTPPPVDPPVGGGGESEGGYGVGIIVYDGDYSVASAIDAVRVELPFPQSPEDKIYRQTYEQFGAPIWAPLALDSECPHDPTAFLVEETEHQSARIARVVQWDRVWARVPVSRNEYEIVNYAYQQANLDGSTWTIFGTMLTRRAKVTYSYHHTTNPEGISLARLPRMLVVFGGLVAFDGATNLALGTTTIARDDTLRRWMGNIWEKTHAVITL